MGSAMSVYQACCLTFKRVFTPDLYPLITLAPSQLPFKSFLYMFSRYSSSLMPGESFKETRISSIALSMPVVFGLLGFFIPAKI